MFNTWKQSSDSYVILQTGPPFQRPRNGKPRRSACNACRTSKIRCTSDLTGCRNCQKRGLDCQYGTEDDTELNIGAVQGQRQLRHRSSGLGMPASPCTREAIPEDNVVSPRPLDVGDLLSDALDTPRVEDCGKETDWSDLDFMFGSETGISPSHNSSSTSPGFDTLLKTAIGMPDLIDCPEQIPRGEAFLAQLPSCLSMRTSGSNLCLPECSPSFHFLSTSDTVTPTEISFTKDDTSQSITPVVNNNNNNSPSSCPCPTTALSTWEMLITGISSKKPATDEFVRCQKAAMSSCEALVRCHGCSARSLDVMLLIDICAKLLESLKTQDEGLFTCHHRQSKRRPVTCGHSTERRMADDDDDDDEDENHVLRSLWMARMRRLGRLIAGVRALLDGEQWLAHRGMLQGVQMAFTSVMFGWQPWAVI
ncbi:hypothetical protein J3459_013948 [Metarhizium acridum]|nr:hypothetical protein J3459_013948 [Metarhizium acridum]